MPSAEALGLLCIRCVRQERDKERAGVVKKRGGNDTSLNSAMFDSARVRGVSVATTLSIASCVGSHFPCDVFFASEGNTTSKKTVFLFLCSFFLLLSNLPPVFVKRNVQN